MILVLGWGLKERGGCCCCCCWSMSMWVCDDDEWGGYGGDGMRVVVAPNKPSLTADSLHLQSFQRLQTYEGPKKKKKKIR